MVSSFTPEDLPMLEGISPGQGVQSLGIYGDASQPGRYRAAVESVLVFRVMTQLNCLLEKDGFLGNKSFYTTRIVCIRGVQSCRV